MEIKIRATIEILGKPKEHIIQTLRDFVKEKIKNNSEIKLISEDYAEAEEREGMFSTFVELELAFKKIDALTTFCFECAPSSIEVISPEELTYNCLELSGLLSDIAARMHTIDAELKKANAEKAILDQNAHRLFRNHILYSISKGDNTLKNFSDSLGIEEKHLTPFVNQLIKEGYIFKEQGVYKINKD